MVTCREEAQNLNGDVSFSILFRTAEMAGRCAVSWYKNMRRSANYSNDDNGRGR